MTRYAEDFLASVTVRKPLSEVTVEPVKIAKATLAERMLSLREQLESLTLTQIDETLSLGIKFCDALTEVTSSPGPPGIKNEAALLRDHIHHKILNMKSLRDRLG